MKKIALSLSLVLFVSISFTACQDEKKKEKSEVEILQEEFDKNMKETVAIHDEVMPKMAEINKLLSQLEINSSKMEKEEYERTSAQLQEAHSEMMSWMKYFSEKFDSKEVNSGITSEDRAELREKNEVLKELKIAAENMRDNILESLQKANELNKTYQ